MKNNKFIIILAMLSLSCFIELNASERVLGRRRNGGGGSSSVPSNSGSGPGRNRGPRNGGGGSTPANHGSAPRRRRAMLQEAIQLLLNIEEEEACG